MSSFEEIMGADGNEDLAAALSQFAKDTADAEALTSYAAYEATPDDTVGQHAKGGDLFALAYREVRDADATSDAAVIVVQLNNDYIYMRAVDAIAYAEWILSRVRKAAARGTL